MRCLFIVFFTCLFLSANSQSENIDDFVEGDLLVLLQPNVNAQLFALTMNNYYADFNVEIAEKLIPSMNLFLLKHSKNVSLNDAKMRLNEFSEVLKVQANHTNLQTRLDSVPDDPRYNTSWCHNIMESEKAWSKTQGGTTIYGDTIVVAVIDGGFAQHDDLTYFKNRHEIAGNNIDDDNNGYVDDVEGWNVYNNSGNVTNDYHGTHVSGIIGAIGNNNLGLVGVNWNVKVMSIQGSSTQESTVLKSYGYAYEMRKKYNETNGDSGAFVVSTNSSFGKDNGQPSNYPLWCAFYDSLGSTGIISAGATANRAFDIDAVGDIPTACSSDYLMSVTNTTNQDVRNQGAAYGLTTIDLGAPGTNILSTVLSQDYDYSTGTSMATPQVAGAIALMYSNACDLFFSEYNYDDAAIALKMKELILESGVDSLADLQGKTVSGGRLNINKAVNAVNEYCRVLSVKNLKTTSANNLLVYPNPSNGFITVFSKEPIQIFTVQGKLIQILPITENYKHEINLSQGFYVLKSADLHQKIIVN